MTLEAQFLQEDADRADRLEMIRKCAALSKPWLAPPRGQNAGQSLPETFQSLGARGQTNLEGQTLQALFPIDTPWYVEAPRTEYRYGNVDPDELNETEQALYIRSLLGQAKLEAAGDPDDSCHTPGFRTAKRQALAFIFGCGDTLERLGDNYRITVFRQERYTTKRNTDCSVIHHMTWEDIDPLTLTEEQFERSKLKREELEDKPKHERMRPLYTIIEYQPRGRNWVIRQEVNGRKINESQEPVSPYFATPFELIPGENYGRGFIELNRGDLRSYDGLCERLLDFAAMASKMTPVIDPSSQITPADLMKPTGTPIVDHVEGGRPKNIAFLQLDKYADFTVVANTAERLRKDLGAAMLLGAETVRDSERTTKFEVQAITIRDVQGALGGFYAPIADFQQVPLVRRLNYQLERDKLLQPVKRDQTEIRVLTGLAALAYESKAQRILETADIMAKFGDMGINEIHIGRFFETVNRYRGVYEPTIFKTQVEKKAEADEALKRAAAAEAAAKAIEVTGNVQQAALTAGNTNA